MSATGGNQPNILFIQVDQLAASFLPAYGNRIAKTPNLDSLAERSAVFDSAYTNFALCAPSRFSMLSGQLASDVGAYDNGAEFPSSVPTFAHYLKAAGYHTCLSGKMHFVGADQLHGYDERLTTDIYPSSFAWTGDWNESTERHSNDESSFTKAGPVTRNVQMDYDEEVLHRARRKLFDLARNVGINDGQPWHMTVSFTHPHDPYQCSHEDWDRYNHDEIDMPGVDTLDQHDPYSLRLLMQYGLVDFQPTDEQVRTARHGYYGSVSYVDRLVGSLLDTLAETRLDANTVVVFSTDHGDMLGERGLWYKRVFYEEASRIPLMVAWPEHVPARHITANASLVDLLPTFLDLASGGAANQLVEPVEALPGRSLVPLITATSEPTVNPDDDVVYGENLAEGAQAPILMVKKGSLKFNWSGLDPAQLFDLSSDPDELTNLADDPARASTVSELEAMVHQQWDVEDLAVRVKASQARRTFLRSLYDLGPPPDWRHVPADQATIHALGDDVPYNEWVYGNILP